VALVALSSCAVSNPEHPLVKAYSAAEAVTPTWNPEISPAEPMWNAKMDIGPVSVTISARCCVGGRFSALYSDERDARVIFQPGDYVYPRALRIDRRTSRVYGMASGLASGIKSTTKIFGYDLAARRLVEAVEVDPGVVPPAAGPMEPRPTR
jgi:hypothetical protein